MKNRLREQDIKRIVDAWDAQQTIPHYCRLVEWSEIEKNDYNLNISRYIQPIDSEIPHDIEAQTIYPKFIIVTLTTISSKYL